LPGIFEIGNPEGKVSLGDLEIDGKMLECTLEHVIYEGVS
jgi:hypothetical protein